MRSSRHDDPSVAFFAAARTDQPRDKAARSLLTEPQREVLRASAAGLTTVEASTDGTMPVRVLIADHVRLRAGAVAAALATAPGIEVVGVVSDLPAAIAGAGRWLPNVPLVSHELIGEDGHRDMRALLAQNPGARPVVLVTRLDPDVSLLSIRAGAIGEVSSQSGLPELFTALRRVHDGQVLFEPERLLRLLREQSEARMVRDSPTTGPLSDRQHEVLRHLASGLTAAEVGQRLMISQHTVRTHVKDILVQLGARSKLEAVVMALRAGWIELPTDELTLHGDTTRESAVDHGLIALDVPIDGHSRSGATWPSDACRQKPGRR